MRSKKTVTLTLLICIIAVMISLIVLGGRKNSANERATISIKNAGKRVANAIDLKKAKGVRSAEMPKPKKTNNQPKLNIAITEDFHDEFIHGEKGREFQKYIMLHDTESDAAAASIVQSWLNQGKGIAAHFVVNKDGTIVQCVPMDKIAHHAGFGNAGHNEKYGVIDESRDDKVGTQSIGSEYPDYGMNSHSIGIEMVHVGGGDEYPVAQLEALDKLIAYINDYYGTKSEIVDHKMWRTTNSDTSPEFATYLSNYISYGKHTAEEEN